MILGPGRNKLCYHEALSECAASIVHHELHAVRSTKSKVSGTSSNLLQDGIVLLELSSEVTHKLHEQVALTHMSLIIVALMTLPHFTPVASWGVIYDQLIGEEINCAWFIQKSAILFWHQIYYIDNQK